MSLSLQVEVCPGCGNLYQPNAYPLCPSCSMQEHEQIATIERHLRRNRFLNNDEVAELAAIPKEKLRTWIRKGRIKLYDYPNLADSCDLCGEPTRQGKLCVDCSTRIRADIRQAFEADRRKKERAQTVHSYFSRR
ncbi:hypothetical protein [Cohnella thermotolerans]|jgi:ribosomal protein L32|uniref:hypothetical protein n=1 Tax=Cohnella thermotolerans TaxID=329858 RepID=UPI0012EC9550|nr:hypothetical protein [Cohnella thermotolerans]